MLVAVNNTVQNKKPSTFVFSTVIVWNIIPAKSINNFFLVHQQFSPSHLAKAHLIRMTLWHAFTSLYSSPWGKKLPCVMRASSLVFRKNWSCVLIYKESPSRGLVLCLLPAGATPWELHWLADPSKWFTTTRAFLPAQNSPMNCCWPLQNSGAHTCTKESCWFAKGCAHRNPKLPKHGHPWESFLVTWLVW